MTMVISNSTIRMMSVVGARPNFMKIAPFVMAIAEHNAKCAIAGLPRIEHTLVHTGQHYDERMSQAFFEGLRIPRPDIDLGIGSGSHAEQVGNTMVAFEKVVREQRPDWVVVVGDVNATCACSITAKKEHVKLAHIEAGLRSFDMTMPEEINRLVTDRLSDLLFTTDLIASRNLREEGVAEERIHLVGNIMIDTLEAHREAAAKLVVDDIVAASHIPETAAAQWIGRDRVQPPLERYAVMTMHRPSNVDDAKVMVPIIEFLLADVCADMPLVWPLHPRAEKQLKLFGLWERVKSNENLLLLHPVGYREMLGLNMGAALMLTDSGGLQEECCVLGTPCLTLRCNTERPVTLREHGGASVLVGNDVFSLRRGYAELKAHPRTPQRPPLWDGHTAERIVAVLAN